MVEPGQIENEFQGVDEVEPTLARLKKCFATGKTKDINWRKQQLRKLIIGI